MKAEELIEQVRALLGKNLLTYSVGRRNRMFMKVKNGYHLQVVTFFHQLEGHLSVISSVDLGEELELVYHFEISPLQVGLKTSAPKTSPRIETISEIYPSAAWYEREAMEMMGFDILNHPDPRHLFLPDEYTECPLRRY